MQYTTIIFDLSEVLIRGLLGVEKTLSPLVGSSERQVLQALCGDHLYGLCEGKISEDEYLEAILKEQQWIIPFDEIKRHIRNNFRYTVSGMVGLISELSKRYCLILHSDHAREWVEHIESLHPFLSLFTTRIFSFDIGSIKNKPGTFEKTLSTANKSAAECLLIDDNFMNITNARCSGIDGIYFTNKQALLRAFARKGIFSPTSNSIVT